MAKPTAAGWARLAGIGDATRHRAPTATDVRVAVDDAERAAQALAGRPLVEAALTPRPARKRIAGGLTANTSC